MSNKSKVLVVEDELTNSVLIKKILEKAGYAVIVANNGLEALKKLEKESFDVVLTDWMMPHIDGIELIRRIREGVQPLPLIIMITALVSQDAKAYALESGADDYIAKPIDVNDLVTKIDDGLKKLSQSNVSSSKSSSTGVTSKPDFIAVAVATSTGGPSTILDIFKKIPENDSVVYLIVQHGPPWMLEAFAQRLQKETNLKVKLPAEGTKIEPGTLYVAPGDFHMRVKSDSLTIDLDKGAKENFVRPSADPLFRSVAETFGDQSIAVILTGLGRDGASGAAQISGVGGKVIIQDPVTATAPFMPNAAISVIPNHILAPLESIHSTIMENVEAIKTNLKKKKKS